MASRANGDGRDGSGLDSHRRGDAGELGAVNNRNIVEDVIFWLTVPLVLVLLFMVFQAPG